MRAFFLPSRGDANAPARSVEQPADPFTEERTRLKNAARQARRDLVQGRKINDAIARGDRTWDDLDALEQNLLAEFKSGRLQRVRNERDAEFGHGPVWFPNNVDRAENYLRLWLQRSVDPHLRRAATFIAREVAEHLAPWWQV